MVHSRVGTRETSSAFTPLHPEPRSLRDTQPREPCFSAIAWTVQRQPKSSGPTRACHLAACHLCATCAATTRCLTALRRLPRGHPPARACRQSRHSRLLRSAPHGHPGIRSLELRRRRPSLLHRRRLTLLTCLPPRPQPSSRASSSAVGAQVTPWSFLALPTCAQPLHPPWSLPTPPSRRAATFAMSACPISGAATARRCSSRS